MLMANQWSHHPGRRQGGVQRRQRARRIVSRHPQTRSPPEPRLLAGRGELPPGGLPMAGPLQHQTTTLPLPPFQPRHLRKDPDTHYAAQSRLTTNPVSTTWGQGPSALHGADRRAAQRDFMDLADNRRMFPPVWRPRQPANCPVCLGRSSRPGNIPIGSCRDSPSRYRLCWFRQGWKVRAHSMPVSA